MFFKKHSEHKKKGGGILGIFRLLLSLAMFALLGVGALVAFKAFSGYDPLKVSPESLFKNLATSDGAYKLITGLLSADAPKSIDDVKKILKGEGAVPGRGPTSNAPLKFRFAVIADSHKDTENLKRALEQARTQDSKFVIGIGDFSDVGTEDELKATKQQFDIVGLPYYVTSGDHDLWESRDKKNPPEQNFKHIFGNVYQAFSYQDVRLILMYNSDNYFGLDGLQLKWIEDEIERLKTENPKLSFVFASTPLFHPSSDHIMGKENDKLKNQSDHLTSLFFKGGVDEVIFADTHFFSRYQEPKIGLRMTTVGAVTSVRNPQSPRFALIDVFEDGSYNIREVEIK